MCKLLTSPIQTHVYLVRLDFLNHHQSDHILEIFSDENLARAYINKIALPRAMASVNALGMSNVLSEMNSCVLSVTPGADNEFFICINDAPSHRCYIDKQRLISSDSQIDQIEQEKS